jgi:hypothetical protein
MAVATTMFALNAGVLMYIGRQRTRKCFTPLAILSAMLSPLYMAPIDLMSMCREKGQLRMLLSAPLPLALATYLLTGGRTLSWVEDVLVVDVWSFVLLFAVRKSALFVINLHEKDEMVRFFKTTCYEMIERAPRAELLYCATTGECAVIGSQIGKLFLFQASRALGLQPVFQAFYLSGVAAFVIMADPNYGFGCDRWWFELHFRRWHRFQHLCAAQYLTKHFDHHDVLPVASIGSQGTGYQEAFFRSIAFWQSPGCALFGPSLFQYASFAGDEWSHNYCPTASFSGVLMHKCVHAPCDAHAVALHAACTLPRDRSWRPLLGDTGSRAACPERRFHVWLAAVPRGRDALRARTKEHSLFLCARVLGAALQVRAR